MQRVPGTWKTVGALLALGCIAGVTTYDGRVGVAVAEPAAAAGAPTLHAPSPTAPPRPVRIVAAGDVHGEGSVRAVLAAGENPLAGVTGALAAADLAVVNLETAVGEPGVPQPKEFVFLADVALLRALRTSGVDVVSLANNHAADHGPESLVRTVAHVRAAGLQPVGAGAHAAEAYRPVYFSAGGRIVGFVGLSRVVPHGFAATDTRPGVASLYDEPRSLAAVREAAAVADVVVVLVHWGAEKAACPDAHARRLSRALHEAGADIVAGHHPHVLQGITSTPTSVTAFSLGNFVWYRSKPPMDATGILDVTVAVDGTQAVDFHPARIAPGGRPTLLSGPAADAAEARLAALTPGGGRCR